MSKRILDLNTISSASNDDYLVVDGSSGTRKITPENVVGNSTVAQALTNDISNMSDDVEEMRSTIGSLQGAVENIPIVDATLSLSGQAADAKVVGDGIADLGEIITKTLEFATRASSGLTQLYYPISVKAGDYLTTVSGISDSYDGGNFNVTLRSDQNISASSEVKILYNKAGNGTQTAKLTDAEAALVKYLVVFVRYTTGFTASVNTKRETSPRLTACFLGLNKFPSFSKSGNDVVVTLPASSNVICEYTANGTLFEIGKQYSAETTFTIPTSSWLCFNATQSTLAVYTNAEITASGETIFPLLISSYGYPKGFWFDLYLKELMASDTDTDGMNPYYTEYMSGKVSNINQTMNYTNGIAFAFLTDVHFPANSKQSKYLLKHILEKTAVPFVICGGDFPVAYGTEADLYDSGNDLLDYIGYVGANRFFVVRGNHDFTIKTDSTQETLAENSGATLPVGYAYNYMMRQQERYVVSSDPSNMAWYIDIPSQKTRIIGINSCDGQSTDTTRSWAVYYRITQAQLTWLLNTATTQDGYKYIFVSHIPSDSALAGYSDTQDVIQALIEAMRNKTNLDYNSGGLVAQKDFSASTSEVICHISGHGHRDNSNVQNNVLSIETTCDAHYQDDGHGAEIGTVTEQAFDVFCINYDTGTIDAVRVGRGNSRQWTY